MVLNVGFAKAKFRIVGDESSIEGIALVDTGAWYTVIDEVLTTKLGVKYTGLTAILTSFSGHRIPYREGIVNSITIEEKTAPHELIAVCPIPGPVKDLLKEQDVTDQIVVGVHSLERLGYAVDVVAHKLIESPGILMI